MSWISRPRSSRANPISSAAHIRTPRKQRVAKAALKPRSETPQTDRRSAAAGADVEDRMDELAEKRGSK